MEYNIFLKYDATEIKIPVLPEEIEISSKSNNETTHVLGIGEISQIKDTKLLEISFSSFFPASPAPYVVEKRNLQKPSYYIDFIEKIRSDKKPVELSISGMYDIDIPATIEKFDRSEKGGQPGDIYYNISFKEYKDYKVKEVDIKNVEKDGETQTLIEEKSQRDSQKSIPKTYTVKKGDSLWKIAKKELGNGSKWEEIAKLNNLKANYVIHPGQVLKLN
ncbi:LysM peptidoglycan-binding domain-containing protein [Abyssisolibacter fermentans]|uniref:LysM peptidoglycan-binding domain-containing protein n=1 Tax=Abyssisolibacter fermentans TaxID=1766203 RepID=UPI00082A614A|nr:LysM peptidoglycan-binding domain-containing protein [Abyssisolibacter fermentans]